MNKHTIWAYKYRPETLDTYICSGEFKNKFLTHIKNNDIPNLILYGKPGGGKSTLANILIKNINCESLYINASDERGIEVVREKITSFASFSSFSPLKIIVLDEADQLTSAAQLSLRNVIETFASKTRFIFTCNYIEKIIEPLQSRCEVHKIEPPTEKDVAKFAMHILNKESIEFQTPMLVEIIKKYYPDVRRIINTLQGSSINNELTTKQLISSSTIEEELLSLLSKLDKKIIKDIRQLLVDNEVRDYDNLYRTLYENINLYLPNQEEEVIILINEHQYKSLSVPDKEICFMSLICSIINLK